jgi:ribosome maturation factor RimP
VKAIPGIEEGVTSRVEELGLEVVDIEWVGSGQKPMIRVRVDHPESAPGRGVTVGDCAQASRAIESWLDLHPEVPERYVLEVSSPGVERPLVRKRDFIRFLGREVDVKAAKGGLGDHLARRVKGVIEGVEDEGDEYSVVLRTAEGGRVVLPRDSIGRANLVFHWNEDG